MVTINYRDSRPIYEQVKDSVRRLIVSGVWVEGQKLPSVRELATELVINPNTIQRAYRELEAEHYIYSVGGKGSFVGDIAATNSVRTKELLEKFDEIVTELSFLGVDKAKLCERLEKEVEKK